VTPAEHPGGVLRRERQNFGRVEAVQLVDAEPTAALLYRCAGRCYRDPSPETRERAERYCGCCQPEHP